MLSGANHESQIQHFSHPLTGKRGFHFYKLSELIDDFDLLLNSSCIEYVLFSIEKLEQTNHLQLVFASFEDSRKISGKPWKGKIPL